MKVCFLTHNIQNDNGGGVLAGRIMRGLQKEFGVNPTIFTVLPSDDGSVEPLLGGRFSFVRDFFRLRRACRGADVIHAFDAFPYGTIAVIAALFLKKPVIVTLNGSGSILPLYSFWQAPLARFALRRAAAAVSISRFTKAEVLKKVPGLSVDVATPGVDFLDWNAPARPGTAPTVPPRYVLSVGSLRWRKGYHRSIAAFGKIAGKFPDLHYVIVGKRYTGLYFERIQKLIGELHLEGRVHIFHSIDDRETLRYLYQRAEVFLLMSQNRGHDVEGFGIVFLEAAAAGLPVIGSRGCGSQDAVRDGENGFLIDERDENAAAKALGDLLSNPLLRARFTEKSLAFAREHDWSRKIAEYAALYRRALETSGKMR
jgi:phosphatidylinositol alpha-1,6-mannosyltransferase